MDNPQWIIVAWLTLIGAAIGSFLNVVVYRLPLGISLINPPSHCPKCKHLIRWYDNVPVVGWIMRRGRCRDCGCAISIRYPLIEAITALIFGLLAAYEYLPEGTNLPRRLIGSLIGLSQQQAFGICLFHALLLCTLLSTALIEIDGQRPPVKLFLPVLLVGFAAPLAWPMLRPMPAISGVPDGLAGAADGLIGAGAGAAIGALVWLLSRGAKPIGLLLATTSVGMVLGWQSVVVLAAIAIAIYVANWILRRVLPKLWQIPATVWLLALTLFWILLWVRFVPAVSLPKVPTLISVICL
jgi:leader peptidase (prepilin peptidase)/N-methyltransferase